VLKTTPLFLFKMPSKNLDGNLIKKAHVQQKWTEQQITELAMCQDGETGPHHFMQNYFYIQHPTKGKLKYQPFDYQKELIDAYHKHRFSIAMMGRQLGKCLQFDTAISVKNDKTGKQYNIPIGLFFEFTQAIRDGLTPPDISKYEEN
jgi:hypothetical protein